MGTAPHCAGEGRAWRRGGRLDVRGGTVFLAAVSGQPGFRWKAALSEDLPIGCLPEPHNSGAVACAVTQGPSLRKIRKISNLQAKLKELYSEHSYVYLHSTMNILLDLLDRIAIPSAQSLSFSNAFHRKLQHQSASPVNTSARTS